MHRPVAISHAEDFSRYHLMHRTSSLKFHLRFLLSFGCNSLLFVNTVYPDLPARLCRLIIYASQIMSYDAIGCERAEWSIGNIVL